MRAALSVCLAAGMLAAVAQSPADADADEAVPPPPGADGTAAPAPSLPLDLAPAPPALPRAVPRGRRGLRVPTAAPRSASRWDKPVNPQQSEPAVAPPVPSEPGPPGSKFSLLLNDGTRLVGVPVGTDALPLESEFGRIEIPLKIIAGAESVPSRSVLEVRLRNGDRITGRLCLAHLEFETSYGRLNVPIESLAALQAGEKVAQLGRTERPHRSAANGKPGVRRAGHSVTEGVRPYIRRGRGIAVPEAEEDLLIPTDLPPAPPAEEIVPLEYSVPDADTVRR